MELLNTRPRPLARVKPCVMKLHYSSDLGLALLEFGEKLLRL